jgi:anti-sigma factor RsiW
MQCAEIKKLLPAYLDGEISTDESKSVKEHLVSCDACRQQAHAFGLSWKALGEYKNIEPDSAYMSRFYTELAQRKTWVERFKETVVIWRPAFVLGCMVVLISSVVLRNQWISSQGVRQFVALNEEELEIVENLELVENVELLEDLEVLENLDVIEAMESIQQMKS